MRAKAQVAKPFRDQSAFRGWLAKRGATAAELFVRCNKVLHRAEGITYREALDEALCYGWIDGVRYAVDAASFAVRFTPRRAGSAWSRVNVKRAQELLAAGRMQKPGAEAFARRKKSRYSSESRPVALSPPLARRLEANKRAWRFFTTQPPWYQRTASFWVMSGKREETRMKRFDTLLLCSASSEIVPPLRRLPPGRERGRQTPLASPCGQ